MFRASDFWCIVSTNYLGNGNAGQELVQLFVVSDGEQQVSEITCVVLTIWVPYRTCTQCLLVDLDLHQFGKLDPDPHHSKKRCCGSGMFIPDLDFYPSQIPDLGSKNSKKREGWKKIRCHAFFSSHKFHEKNLGLFSKKYRTFYPKICH